MQKAKNLLITLSILATASAGAAGFIDKPEIPTGGGGTPMHPTLSEDRIDDHTGGLALNEYRINNGDGGPAVMDPDVELAIEIILASNPLPEDRGPGPQSPTRPAPLILSVADELGLTDAQVEQVIIAICSIPEECGTPGGGLNPLILSSQTDQKEEQQVEDVEATINRL